jgi:hypothetical protein
LGVETPEAQAALLVIPAGLSRIQALQIMACVLPKSHNAGKSAVSSKNLSALDRYVYALAAREF